MASAVLFGLTGQAAADHPECDTYVVGTGNPAVDVPAVQSGLYAGGTVCIEGTVALETTQPPQGEFGECPPANLSQLCVDPDDSADYVALVGVDGKDGEATLLGGRTTLLVPSSTDVETIWIDNLRSVGAHVFFLLNNHGNGELFAVTNVDVVDLVADEAPFLNFVLRFQTGMQTSSGQEDVTATVIYAHNTVSAVTPDSEGLFLISPVGIANYGAFAAFSAGEWLGDLVLMDNRVSNFGGSQFAIAEVANVWADGNVARTSGEVVFLGQPGPHPCVTGGAGVGFAAGFTHTGGGPAHYEDNRVIINPASDLGDVRCQPGFTFFNALNVTASDFRVDVSDSDGEDTRAVVVVDSSNLEIGDFRIEGAAVGTDTVGTGNASFSDGNITGATTCIQETESENITYDEVNCRSTPPGHGGTPPGQGGTPPGQGGGD